MGSRGRGGYGRGGSTLPFVVANEPTLGPMLQPPPLYPQTDKKVIESKCDVDMEYLLLLDRVLRDNYNDFFETVEAAQTAGDSNKLSESFLWAHMPTELRPKVKMKVLSIKSNIINADAELNRLENLEKKTAKTGDQEDIESVMEVEEFDEEMDEGTDYANDYFDNGEMYEENDDGESGPVY